MPYPRLAQPLRSTLLAAARSKRLEHTAANLRLTRTVVDRFVAGETEQQAVDTARGLLDSGRYITIDHLGEDTTDAAQAQATVSAYLSLLSALAPLAADSAAGAHRPRPVEVSLKLSALGQSLPVDGDRIALDNAHKICAAAEEAGVWVTVDAEDHTTTDSTLSIVRSLRADFPSLGTVLQAYLKRTEGDCAELAGTRIRLCKGAYAEPASVAYQGAAVDEAYVRCLRVLLGGGGYPMVATHDPAMISAALDIAAERGLASDEFELQMLFGVRDVEQRRLAAGGRAMRVYLPYGTQWYGYFMRRMAEKPANLGLFLRALASRK
ncbi:proline dehydrogenase [Saccharomonospora sp. CUA-673]|uniref:proline dehydrogenase family protein n=1 Tax=Saccharomonospora sp. CUA-673 TaxID=1904969 RepID=UPI000967C668|nr:proline dehydrogenase family protein [Saccharomonospora sp. CUA-673]OLT41349.1 proline dehydrogenase [Saccharomonospora sp. CUA-673]